MPTHQTVVDGVTKPYAYCPICGWHQVTDTAAEAEKADVSHQRSEHGAVRIDSDGNAITPEA